jgi:hypothetical protein
MAGSGGSGLLIERTIRIRSSPRRVVAAFFDPRDLLAWWDVRHAVTAPRPLAPYAVQWPPTEFTDELLGHLGGTLHGLVMDVQQEASFFLADLYYTPPAGAPIGPMALDVRAHAVEDGRTTELTLRQSADEEGERAQRCFTVMARSWDRALDALKEHLEWSGVRPARGSPWAEPEGA